MRGRGENKGESEGGRKRTREKVRGRGEDKGESEGGGEWTRVK